MDDKTKTGYGYDPFAKEGRDRWGSAGAEKEGAPEIPNYQIIDRLGAGGMGTVWSAKYIPLNQPRAVKVLGKALAMDAKFLERFGEEAKALARLEHPNIVRVYDASSDFRCPYIAMDFVGGKTMSDILKTRSFTQDEALKYFGQIADALDYAHGMGFIHRDIKPSNVMISNAGKAMLIDFGVANWLGGEGESSHTLTGTTRYMSPEACKDERVTMASDLWAFGILMYRTMTGSLPFEGKTEKEIMNAIISSPPKEPNHPNGRVRAVLKSFLVKDPKGRPKSAVEMVAELQKAAKPFALKTHKEGLAVGTSFILVGVVSVVLIGGVIGYFATQKPKSSEANSGGTLDLKARLEAKLHPKPEASTSDDAPSKIKDLRGVWYADFGNKWAEIHLEPTSGKKFHVLIASRDPGGLQSIEGDGEVSGSQIKYQESGASDAGGTKSQLLGNFEGKLSEDHGRIIGKHTSSNGEVLQGQWVRADDVATTQYENSQQHYSVPIPVGWQASNGDNISFSPIGRSDVVFTVTVAPANGVATMQDVFVARERDYAGASLKGGSYQNISVNPSAPLGGRQGVSWEFRHQVAGAPTQHAILVGLLRSDTSVTVECWWPASEEDVWPQILDSMRKRFRFTE
jgi:serine/threonine protein kinase